MGAPGINWDRGQPLTHDEKLPRLPKPEALRFTTETKEDGRSNSQ